MRAADLTAMFANCDELPLGQVKLVFYVACYKGSLAEFELGLLRQRARAAFEQKVGRGHILWEPPVGFVRTEDHRVEKIADRQVHEALTGLFRKFRKLGSARQTTLWYCQEQVVLPEAVSGTAGKEIVWRVPGRHRILQILKNPCYAGAFAYGKTVLHTTVKEGRARAIGATQATDRSVEDLDQEQPRRLYHVGRVRRQSRHLGGQSKYE